MQLSGSTPSFLSEYSHGAFFGDRTKQCDNKEIRRGYVEMNVKGWPNLETTLLILERSFKMQKSPEAVQFYIPQGFRHLLIKMTLGSDSVCRGLPSPSKLFYTTLYTFLTNSDFKPIAPKPLILQSISWSPSTKRISYIPYFCPYFYNWCTSFHFKVFDYCYSVTIV